MKQFNTGERRARLDELPLHHPLRTQFVLVCKIEALKHEHHTLTIGQHARLPELQTAFERITTANQRTNMAGLTALQVQRAAALFDDIMGEDWHPRDDNPIAREYLAEFGQKL